MADRRELKAEDAGQLYISITGLRLKGPWHALRFWRYAIPAMRQAKQAPGNLQATAKTIAGVHHTLSVWESKAAMRAFLYAGAHKQAIKAFPIIATGKTFGFESDHVPDWDEVHRLWHEHGRDYASNPEERAPIDAEQAIR